jgi:hypothetical protein
MKFKGQVVTLLDDGEESLREVACIERDELSAVSLGLSMAESKTMLQGIQEVLVEWQMTAYLDTQRHCPQCGKRRHHKGSHHTVFRTVFGDVPVESLRCTHCPCQAHETESFSPLAELLPERTTPELLYLETKWASLSSYGMTIKLTVSGKTSFAGGILASEPRHSPFSLEPFRIASLRLVLRESSYASVVRTPSRRYR